MAVVYLSIDIQICGLELRTIPQFEELRAEIGRRLNESPLPYQRAPIAGYDVVVSDEAEIAGKFEDEELFARSEAAKNE